MFTNSKRLFEVTVIYNKSNHFGLEHDAELIKRSFANIARVKYADPLEVPTACDINIHLEIPIYSYVPWSTYNIFVMNPEHYVKESWDPYLKHFDKIITKESLDISGAHVLPWDMLPFTKTKVQQVKEFLYLLGGSKNKREFATHFIKGWKETYPTLHVYSVEPLNIEVGSNVKLYVEDLTSEKRKDLLQIYQGHVCCSMSEGFGYTAAEANYVNAFTILNTLPVYVQDYSKSPNVHWIETPTTHSNDICPYGSFVSSVTAFDLDSAIEKFRDFTPSLQKKQEVFKNNLLKIMDTLVEKKKIKTLPPLLDRKECPYISIVTLVYNRRIFFDLARHNMILTDYPKNKIQWIIVDDSDIIEEQSTDKIIQTQNQFTDMDVMYVPLLKKTPISQKRNIGVERASHDIVLFMDDDDHYPETSFRRRVAWLKQHPMKPKAVSCTTIACYDLIKGVSAVNCPPLHLPLGQRISEATLTFYKSWFLEKKFDKDIQVGEGESLLKDREGDLLEIPPQQVIVAFSHNKNISSRRIPSAEDISPSCFWGFPKEYLQFIHNLAGIKVV